MRRVVLMASVLVGCAPSAPIALLPELPAGGARLFFTLGAGGEILELVAFDDERRPDPLNLPDTAQLRLLAYREPLASLMAPPDDDGRGALARADASSDDAWALLAPEAAFDSEGEVLRTRPVAEILPWLSSFRVPRPPCPPPPTVRPIEGLGPHVQLTFALRWGDEIILGTSPQADDATRGVFRLPIGQLEAQLIPMFHGGGGLPTAFIDGDLAHVMWFDPVTRVWSLWGIDKSGSVIERLEPSMEGTGGVTFEALSAARFEGSRTLIARILREDRGEVVSQLVRLDEATRTWRIVHTSPREATLECPFVGESLILEIDGPQRGLVGLKFGPLTRFDLSVPGGGLDGPPLIAQRQMCRNARTVLDDGVELVAYAGGGDEPAGEQTGLWWRRPGERWDRAPTPNVLSGQALASIGNFAIAGAEGHSLALFEHVPARPELPPRNCFVMPAGSYASHMLKIDASTLFVGGSGGTGAVFLDF